MVEQAWGNNDSVSELLGSAMSYLSFVDGEQYSRSATSASQRLSMEFPFGGSIFTFDVICLGL